MCLEGLRKSLGATFVNYFNLFWMVLKVFGKVQEGPRSPPDPLKNYLISGKFPKQISSEGFWRFC